MAPDGSVTGWNPAAERLFGYSEPEVLGRPLPIVPDALRGEFDAIRTRVLAGEKLGESIRPARRKDGSTIEVLTVTASCCDASGKPIGLMTLFTPAPASGPPPAPQPAAGPA
jgi:PAS domain S-box-containing protein